MQKIRVKIGYFVWLWQMDGGLLLFGWWIHDRWVKTCLRGVLSSYPTPMFISRAIMKKSIFENFEILSFWAIFTVFLGYFPYCKNRPKNPIFRISIFLAESVDGTNQCSQEAFWDQNELLRTLVWPLNTLSQKNRDPKNRIFDLFLQ